MSRKLRGAARGDTHTHAYSLVDIPGGLGHGRRACFEYCIRVEVRQSLDAKVLEKAGKTGGRPSRHGVGEGFSVPVGKRGGIAVHPFFSILLVLASHVTCIWYSGHGGTGRRGGIQRVRVVRLKARPSFKDVDGTC